MIPSLIAEHDSFPQRCIMLIDMDAYFASIEQAENPALRGKPIIVCGKGRTVVSAASYQAKAKGIKAAMSVPEAKRLCPRVITVYGDLHKYVEKSKQIHEILLTYTQQMEPYSIDECYMDISALVKKGGEPRTIAMEIKGAIKAKIGITCSIGIGPNKVIAKIGSKLNKPDGLTCISPAKALALLKDMPIKKLQGVGIGKKMAQKLKDLGINTAGALGSASVQLLCSRFGVMGYTLKSIGLGEDDTPVGWYFDDERSKSVGHSFTLPQDTAEMAVIRSYIRMLSEKVSFRLRQADMIGKTIGFVIRYSDFKTQMKHKTLPAHVQSGYHIYTHALKMLSTFLPLRRTVRMVGVSVSSLILDTHQQNLFSDTAKRDRLQKTIDTINDKYGEFSLKPTTLLIAESFKEKGRAHGKRN